MVSSKVEALRLQLIFRLARPRTAIYKNILLCTHAMLALAAFELICSVALAGAGIISLAVAVTSLMRAGACRILMHYDMCGYSAFVAAVAYSKAQAGAVGISAALLWQLRQSVRRIQGL